MDRVTGRITVFFEDPFWVGVFEQIENGRLSAAKVTFGTEPKDYELYEYILKHYYHLRYSPDVAAVVKNVRKNPKRIRNDVKKELQSSGIGGSYMKRLDGILINCILLVLKMKCTQLRLSSQDEFMN